MAEDHVNSPTEYQLLEEELTSSTEKVYILTASQLPSHIRSVEVKHNSHLADLSSVYCSSRTINIILILVFVFVMSLTVSIAVYKITEITDPGSRLQSIHVPYVNSSNEPQQLVMTTERENSTFYLESNTIEMNLLKTRHCSHKCHMYSDKKFQSECAFGRCVCRGETYQFLTCLPSVVQCTISKGFFPYVSFSMDNITIPVYSCRPDMNSSGNNLYIVSVYGNHYASSTIIDIKGESTEPVILVLANYYPVTWRVMYNGLTVKKIILATQSKIESSDVETVPNTPEPDENSKAKPKISAMQIPVGFGNDIHESKTVEMLKLLSERKGIVRMFAGAYYADYISLQIDENS